MVACETCGMDARDAEDRFPSGRQMRAVIERLVRDGTATARSDGTSHRVFPTAVSAAEGESLRSWVTREGARRTIETGLGYGLSCLFVVEGLLANVEAGVGHVVID